MLSDCYYQVAFYPPLWGFRPFSSACHFTLSIAYLFTTIYIVPAGNAASWSCYILLMQVQALCVACDYFIINSLPLGLGRYPFPDFFRIDNSDLLAGFSQNGDSLHFKRLTSNKLVHQLEYHPIYGISSRSPHYKLLSAPLLREDGTHPHNIWWTYGQNGSSSPCSRPDPGLRAS